MGPFLHFVFGSDSDLNIELIFYPYQVLSVCPPVNANHSYNLSVLLVYYYQLYTITLKPVLPFLLIIFTIHISYINWATVWKVQMSSWMLASFLKETSEARERT